MTGVSGHLAGTFRLVEGGEERGRNEDRLLGPPGSSICGSILDLAPT